MHPTTSPYELFVRPLSRQNAALTTLSALIRMTCHEPFVGPLAPPKCGPRDLINNFPPPILMSPCGDISPDHEPIRAIRISMVPSTGGSHNSIGTDSNKPIRTIRMFPVPPKNNPCDIISSLPP